MTVIVAVWVAVALRFTWPDMPTWQRVYMVAAIAVLIVLRLVLKGGEPDGGPER